MSKAEERLLSIKRIAAMSLSSLRRAGEGMVEIIQLSGNLEDLKNIYMPLPNHCGHILNFSYKFCPFCGSKVKDVFE